MKKQKFNLVELAAQVFYGNVRIAKNLRTNTSLIIFNILQDFC